MGGAADTTATAGEVLRASLVDKAGRLVDLAGPARQDEPDAVHQMRVATRTLRSTLKTFGPLLDTETVRYWDAELRWLGGVLGAARDAEVLEAQLLELLALAPGHLVRGPVRERISTELVPRRAIAWEALLAALDSERYAELADGLVAFADAPPFTADADRPALRVLPHLVDRARRRVRRRMREALALSAGAERDEKLHRARKAARQTRYAAEAVTPVFGEGARKLAQRMKGLQDVLGSQRDRMVAGDAVAELGGLAQAAGEDAFTFGLLRGYAEGDARVFDEKVRKGWKKAGRGRRRGWSG